MDDKGHLDPTNTSDPELELPIAATNPVTMPTPEATPPPPTKTEEPPSKPPETTSSGQAKKSWHRRFVGWATTHKKISLPLAIAVGLAIIFAIPWSRYQAAGLVLKQIVTIKVLDSTTGSPV